MGRGFDRYYEKVLGFLLGVWCRSQGVNMGMLMLDSVIS